MGPIRQKEESKTAKETDRNEKEDHHVIFFNLHVRRHRTQSKSAKGQGR